MKSSDNSCSDTRSVKAGVRRGRSFNTNWVSVRNGAPHVMGFVNGTKCKIVPDTGAEISIVPGCLVYGEQLTGEVGQGKSLSSRWLLHTRTVFVVLCCSLLLLDAASKSDDSGFGAGQLRGTRNIQPSTQVDACSDGVVEEAPETSSAPAITQEETVNVRVVTRSKSKKLAEKEMHDDVVHVSESNAQPFDSDAEFNRLAAIDLSYDPPIVGDAACG